MQGAQRIHAAVLGASGFGGGELLRLLAMHPQVHSVQTIAHSNAGAHIASVHPHLRAQYPGTFSGALDYAALHAASTPVLFAALPHGAFAALWNQLKMQLPEHCVVVDLSGDFRLNHFEDFVAAYGGAHPCTDQLSTFHYGMAASHAPPAGQLRLANPGCFATAINLALLPLSEWDADWGHIAISAVTGSSGSGAQTSANTHHATRAHDFRAYKVLQHQHHSEVTQFLALHRATDQAPLQFSLVPHSAPMVRGIYATVQCGLPAQVDLQSVQARFQQRYAAHPLVHIVADAPARLAPVLGSAFAEISVHATENRLAICCAIDNLGLGMSAQAIANMNQAVGLPTEYGLLQASVFP